MELWFFACFLLLTQTTQQSIILCPIRPLCQMFMLNLTKHNISYTHKKLKYCKIKALLTFKLLYIVFTMLINVKMLTIFGKLIFISIVNIMCS